MKDLSYSNCCQYCRFMRDRECHKNPPMHLTDGWPLVKMSDWCGEFSGNREWEALRDRAEALRDRAAERQEAA